MQMNNVQTSALNDMITKFKDQLKIAAINIVDACRIYVNAIDNVPEAKEAFTHEFPNISSTMWKRYEAIGRGHILPEIASNPMKFSDSVIEKFPLSDQKLLVESQVEVITTSGDVIKTTYANMTEDQKRILFARDHIRTLPEQKAFIEKERAENVKAQIKKQSDTTEELRNECLKLLLNKALTTTTLTKIRKILKGV